MRFHSFLSGVLLAAWIGGSLATPSSSGALVTLPYNQTFSTTSADVRTDPNYPEFSDAFPSSVLFPVDSSHILHLQLASNNETLATVSPSPYNTWGEITIQADVTATNSNGNYNVGFKLGTGANANSVVFHPGFAGGAFRVEGTGGGALNSNTNMGYTPANNVFQHMKLDLFSNGLVNVQITDSADPINHIFTASYTNAAVYDSLVALRRFGNSPGDGLFTNFSVTQVPEPTAIGMMAAAGIGMIRRRASQRPQV